VVVYQNLPNAPITEALIDFRTKVKSGFDVNLFQSIYEVIKDKYPEKRQQKKADVKVELKARGPSVIRSVDAVNGYIFTSADKRQILQVKLDGFTFNRLKPYENWKLFRDEAHRLWQLFKEIASPDIIRVAVRYINKFAVPLPIKDFNEYLTAAPAVPSELPQGVMSFLSRVVIAEPEIDATVIITQALEQTMEPASVPIILDIDAYRLYSDEIGETEAWVLLEKLHDLKNRVFFSSITKKAMELFR
jgi:uncharacterized protein (TIGR04255 family)